MPFYEYECSNCKFYVEVLQKISDEPLRDCPSCKKPQLKKLVSAPVFRLKGAGWYETDFKGDNEGKRNLADREEAPEKSEDKAASAPTAESADTKSVSKPEVSSVSGKKAAAKPEHKAKPKAPPAKVAAKSAKASKPSKPAKKAAPAKKKAAKRR
jgi:putative FmdB family regulatory protein